MLTTEEKERYARHLSLPGFGDVAQLKLKAAKVAVIGAGGLGCPVLQYLAAAGVGHLTIIDGDSVSVSNLQRQVLFTDADVGRNKAEVAAERLCKQNPHVHVTPLPHFLTQENALDNLANHDIIIDGSDNFGTRYLVNDAAVILGIPLVFGSIFKFEGQVSVFNYEKGPTYRCLFPEPPGPGEVPSCSEVGVIGVLPGIIGSLQAAEAIKVLTGVGNPLSGRLLIYNALTNEQTQLSIKAIPENLRIQKLGDYAIDCAVTPSDEISAEVLNSLLAQGKVLLIDVREREEYETFNIGGKNIPLSELPDRLKEIPREKQIVLHCQSGKRSRKAMSLLQDHGYQDVYSLMGGIEG